MKLKVEKNRLLKSFTIQVSSKDELGQALPEHCYYCTGGSEGHYVTTEPYMECDCADWNWNDEFICKHLLRALIVEDNPRVRGLLTLARHHIT